MDLLVCFLLLGIPGWLAICIGFISSWRFKRREQTETVRAEAVFTGYKKVPRKSGMYSVKDTYQPMLRYMADAREYNVISSYYHEQPRLTPGDTVVIFYDPSKPQRIRLEEESAEGCAGLVRLGILLLLFAAVLSVFAYIFAFR